MSEQVKFNLLKYNRHGKKQQRTLILSDRGIINKDGSKTKWERPPTQIHSIHVSDQEPKGFVIQLLDSYRFETESPEQVKQIVDTFRQLGLGEIIRDQVFPACTDDDIGRLSNPGGPLSSQGPGQLTSSQQPPVNSQSRVRPMKPDLTDEQDYAAPTGLNPLAQFRFERPPKFPVPAPSHERLMKPQNFELVACLGKGSFGEVFLVRRVEDSRFFAMKVLKKRAIIDRNQLGHLRAEHTILQAMQHPYMVRLFHSFQTRTRLFLVMNFALGGEMFHQLKRVGQFPENLAVFYLAEVLEAFDGLHSCDIVFRDTKPENLLLDAKGHVLLADFGLARTGVSASAAQAPGAAAYTFCGTPDYLSAEVLAGVPYGRSVDVWAAGALLFEMLVGKAPFSFGSKGNQGRTELYRRILRGALVFPPSVSPEARDFIFSCLKRRPRDRLTLEQLKQHKIFKKHNIDFEKIKNRQQEPPQRIRVDEACIKAVEGRLLQNKNDNVYRYVLPDALVTHFDSRFTKEQPTLAASQKQDAVTADEDKHFKDFNWTAPWAFDPVPPEK